MNGIMSLYGKTQGTAVCMSITSTGFLIQKLVPGWALALVPNLQVFAYVGAATVVHGTLIDTWKGYCRLPMAEGGSHL